MYTTLPTIEQVMGDTALGVLKQYGRIVNGIASTDLARLQGAETKGWSHERTVALTRSVYQFEADDDASPLAVDSNQPTKSEMTDSWIPVGVRPLIPSSQAALLSSSLKKQKDDPASYDRVFYGEYPQTVVDRDEALEAEYRSGRLKKTGKAYTFMTDWRPVRTHVCVEFEYDGKRYIRLPKKCQTARNPYNVYLNKGGYSAADKPYWLAVEPIQWLRDSSGVLLSKKVLFSGVPVSSKGNYDGHFERSLLGKYMCRCFDKEMLPLSAYLALKKQEKADRDLIQAEIKKRHHNRKAVRRFFATLRGERQLILAEILAGGTDTRNQRAKQIKSLRYWANEALLKADERLKRTQKKAVAAETEAQKAEAEGMRALLQYQQQARLMRRQAKKNISAANRHRVKVIQKASLAREKLQKLRFSRVR